jgi:hypothetical protein
MALILLGVYLVVEENAILGVIGVVMDTNPSRSLLRRCVVVLKPFVKLRGRQLDFVADYIHAALAFAFRIAAPLALLVYSFTRQSIWVMNPFSVAAMCVSLGCFTIVNAWRFGELIWSMVKAYSTNNYKQPRKSQGIPYDIFDVIGFLDKNTAECVATVKSITKPVAGVAQRVMKNQKAQKNQKKKFLPQLETISEV